MIYISQQVLLYPSVSVVAQKPFYDFTTFPVPHAIPYPPTSTEVIFPTKSHPHHQAHHLAHIPTIPKPLPSLHTYPPTAAIGHMAPFQHFPKVPHIRTYPRPHVVVQSYSRPKAISHLKPANFVNFSPLKFAPSSADPKKKVPMKAMGVVELVKSNGEGDVKMTAFVNLGNEEEEEMMAVNQEMEEAIIKADGATRAQLMKAKKEKKKKEKLVAMAMERLKKMELGMEEEERGDMMRLIALEPQVIGPVVEVGISSSSFWISHF